MENKKLIVMLVALGILLIVLGFFLGLYLQPNNKNQAVKGQAVSSLSLKTISSITAYGKVENINGREITISNLGDNMAVPMSGSANIYTFVASSKKGVAPARQNVLLSDIKVGDSVNIALKLTSTGQLQGQSLVVLP